MPGVDVVRRSGADGEEEGEGGDGADDARGGVVERLLAQADEDVDKSGEPEIDGGDESETGGGGAPTEGVGGGGVELIDPATDGERGAYGDSANDADDDDPEGEGGHQGDAGEKWGLSAKDEIDAAQERDDGGDDEGGGFCFAISGDVDGARGDLSGADEFFVAALVERVFGIELGGECVHFGGFAKVASGAEDIGEDAIGDGFFGGLFDEIAGHGLGFDHAPPAEELDQLGEFDGDGFDLLGARLRLRAGGGLVGGVHLCADLGALLFL